MTDDQRTDVHRNPSRRSTLQTLGTLLATGSLSGVVTAQQDDGSYQITQAGQTLPVEPLSGDVPVEERYSYRLPDQYEGVGVHDVDGGPYYESAGTVDLQRESTTITFLYDGPDGLSLVTVHGMATPDGDGGSVTWDVVADAADAEWLVRDDLYWDRDTGERPPSNVDNWDVEGDEQRIDWTWSGQATDGGVLGHLDEASALRIDPSYNEDATLYGEQYEGTVTDWQFLSGDADDPDRYALALDDPVTVVGPAGDAAAVEGRSADDGTDEPTATETATDPEDDATETETTDTESPDETDVEEETEVEDESEEVTELREAIAEYREAIEAELAELAETQEELEEASGEDAEELREVVEEKREKIREWREELTELREELRAERENVDASRGVGLGQGDDESGLGLGRENGNGNGPKREKGHSEGKQRGRGNGEGRGNGRGRGN